MTWNMQSQREKEARTWFKQMEIETNQFMYKIMRVT